MRDNCLYKCFDKKGACLAQQSLRIASPPYFEAWSECHVVLIRQIFSSLISELDSLNIDSLHRSVMPCTAKIELLHTWYCSAAAHVDRESFMNKPFRHQAIT